jgi:SAM-dependent methyltransferase
VTSRVRAAARAVLTQDQRIALRRLVVWPPASSARRSARWRLVPLSRRWGSERGRVIDRYYIEQFLEQHRSDICGAVLEVGASLYTRRFGDWPQGAAVTSSDILDPDPEHDGATVIADLTEAPQLEDAQWDCIICTNVLGLIYELDAAVSTLARILKPGGTLLATVPACCSFSGPDRDLWGDYWRFTPASARTLFERAFAAEHLEVAGHGNLLSASAFLQGLAREDLRGTELDHVDAAFPLVVSIRACRPLSGVSVH